MGKPQTGLKKPPDQVRRRNTTLVTNLPPEGRDGPVPKWPLKGNPTAEEKRRWQNIWATPQAVVWEQWHLELVVARYIRVAVAAEAPGAPATLLGEARRFESDLGLTPRSILSLQWTLASKPTELASVTDLDAQLKAAQK